MKPHLFVYGLLIVMMSSCDISHSVNKDLVTGMVTRGNGLSCQDVELLAGDEKVRSATFLYGEEIRIEFNAMEGFERAGAHAFPGMKLTVTENRKDTVLVYEDLYAELIDGTSNAPLSLLARLVLADPIRSGGEYTLFVNTWDKKGEGVFATRLKFGVVPDDGIHVEADRLTWDEVYLYSGIRQRTLTDHRAGFNETIYLILEGLDGFSVHEGEVQLGLALSVTDSTGRSIIVEEDLLGHALLDAEEIGERLAPHFIITDRGVINPVGCEVRVWDKNSGGYLRASTHLTMKRSQE